MSNIDHVEEPDIPRSPITREGESCISGRNNQLIIFGRDRPAGIESGHGSEKNAGTIHIVVGRHSQDVDFAGDSSFAYLSMKTDVDKNLGVSSMTDGSGAAIEQFVGPAIALKSDSVRVVHRSNGDVRISSDDGKNFILLSQDRCEIKLGASWLQIRDGTITVQAGTIKLGDGATREHVILGDTFISEFLQHVHQSPVGPTSSPLPPGLTSTMSGRALSQKSWVE